MIPKLWTYEGQAYCVDCVADQVEHDDPEWSPRFELDDSDLGCCCGTCGHNLACANKVTGPMWDNCPGCREVTE